MRKQKKRNAEKVTADQKFLPKINKSAVSLDRRRQRSQSRVSGTRNRNLSLQSRRKPNLSVRLRGRSSSKRREKSSDYTARRPKDACVQCKIDWLNHDWQRGRRRKRDKDLEQKSCCAEEVYSRARNIHYLICSTALECMTIEFALASVVQMLLIRSGIETNPGPSCCSASLHFKRVNNSIATAERNFQSRLTPSTLSDKNIEIVETGKYSNSLFSLLTIQPLTQEDRRQSCQLKT